MNTLPTPLHGEWTDSMADWAMRNPLVTARPEFRDTVGEVHQHVIDRLPEAFDTPEKEPHRKQRWLIVALAVALGAVMAAVCLINYARVST